MARLSQTLYARVFNCLRGLVGLMISCLMVSSVSALAGQVKVKKTGTKLYASPSSKAEVVEVLKKGEQLESIERKGMYWKVQKGSMSGYVSVMKVKRAKGKSSLSNALRKAVKKGRQDEAMTSRARSSVMGVRGLDTNKDGDSAGNVRPDLKAVYELEDKQVRERDLGRLENLVQKEIETRMDAE